MLGEGRDGAMSTPSDTALDRRELVDAVADHSALSLADLVRRGAEGRGILALLANTLPITVVVISSDRTFQAAYGAGMGKLGLTQDDLVGMPCRVWGPEADAAVERCFEGEQSVFDFRGEFNDTPFLYRVLLVPSGDIAVAFALNLSDELKASLVLSEQEELLRAAIHELDVGVLVQDRSGRVISSNPMVARLLGPAADGILNGEVAELSGWAVRADGSDFRPADFPSHLALDTGTPQRNVTVGARQPGGEICWLQVSSFPLTLEGQPVVLSTLTDITHRQATAAALRDSEDRFRLLAEEAPLGIFIADVAGALLYVNPMVEEITGRTFEEVRRTGWIDVIHPDDRDQVLTKSAVLRAGQGGEFLAEYRLVRDDGSVRWIRARAAGLSDENGTAIGSVGTMADITDVREVTERLREREERTRAILETAAEGIISCNEQGIVLEFNAAAERIFEYDSDEVVGRMHFSSLLAPPDRDVFSRRFADFLGGSSERLSAGTPREVICLRRDGSSVPIELAVTEVRTTEGRLFTGVLRDISERKAFERELERLATHDALTGLPNRVLLNAQLDAALGRARLRRSSVGILFVDIDRVALVTEALGHRAGDDLILQVAERILAVAGPSALVARFANDQFVIVIEDLDEISSAVDVAVGIIESVNEPFIVADEEGFVNASVGIVVAREGHGVGETLISNAGVAMSRAKESSATRFEVFDLEMRALVDSTRRLEIGLRHGIERGEFDLHFQPVVSVADRSVIGLEALVRWDHPQLGQLLPGEFIPVAEESGLIVPLGDWILEEACRRLAEWQHRLGGSCPMVSVNLSARQLGTPGLAERVREVLRRTGADASGLAFEITETVLLSDVDAAVSVLHELRSLGVRLELDDFGTGYSSLTYLCQLPIDVVKIDRSFVSQLGAGTRDEPVVEMIIGMADTLRLDTVAEGVETEEQARALGGLGCPYAQGYLYAKPQAAADIDLLLGEWAMVSASGPAERIDG